MPVVGTDLSFRYRRGPWIFRHATFDIADGESIALTGPSGSGKTTLLNLIGGLTSPGSGSVRVSAFSPDSRWVNKVAWVFQTPTVFGRRSALENITTGLLNAGIYGKASRDAAQELVGRMGLTGLEHRRANSLSGGELQRVSIARSLIGEPALILADEPTGELDRSTTTMVVETMVEVRHPESILIFATHDDEVASRCDRRFAIHDGSATEIT